MKILVRNLERSVSRGDLVELFKPFGTLQACDLVMDKATGLSKGFGFVDMPDDAEAKEAIQKLNGQVIRKMKIRVKRTLRGAPKIPYQKKAWRRPHG